MKRDARRSVLFVIRSLDTGGGERQFVAHAVGLHRRGYRVSVAVFYGGGSMEPELQVAGVPVFSLEKTSRWDLGGPLMRLAGHIRAERPDVVYSFMEGANALSAMVRTVAPPFRLVWGIRTAELRSAARGSGSKLLFPLTCALSRRPDLIISNSHAGAAAHAARGYPAKRIRVIPNGIDTNRFSPDPEGGRAWREAWRVLPDERVVGLVGRLDRVKDHPSFLRAVARLRRDGMRLRIVCAGQGNAQYMAELQAHAMALEISDAVEWISSPPSMSAFYSALDLLCLSSHGEGFPNVLAEAMACEIPCVATDVGDARIILGEYGVVVPPQDDIALARGIQTAFAKSTSDSRARGRARIIDHFGLEALLDSTTCALWGTADGSHGS